MSLATLLSITYADVARLAKLKSASYLCLWDETVSPGLPTRTRLLIRSHQLSSRRLSMPFHLSVSGLSSGAFPDSLPGELSTSRYLRTNLGPGANLALLRTCGLRWLFTAKPQSAFDTNCLIRSEANHHCPDNMVCQYLPGANLPSRVPDVHQASRVLSIGWSITSLSTSA